MEEVVVEAVVVVVVVVAVAARHLRRRRLDPRRQRVELPRLFEVLLALAQVGHLQMDPPVHRLGQFGHRARREVVRVLHRRGADGVR